MIEKINLKISKFFRKKKCRQNYFHNYVCNGTGNQQKKLKK